MRSRFKLVTKIVLGCCLGGLLGCGAGSDTTPGSGGGTGGGGGTNVDPGAGTGGATTSGSGGTPGTTGGSSTGGKMGTSGVDDGSLFKDAGSVTSILADAGSGTTSSSDAGATTKDGGGSGIPGDGNMATGKVSGYGIRAVFTQKGLDVVLVITATNCPAGSHTFTIHEGFACDDPTKGPVWGNGKRGGGIPPLVCDANRQGTLTYTRTGADPTTNWTVADHNQNTDLTLHPLMADTQCGTFF